VQVKIHDAKTRGIGDQLPTLDELGPQVLLLVLVERLALMLGDVIVSGQKEPACACGRIAYDVVDRRLDEVDDQSPERCWILDFRAGLFEDLSKHPRLLAKFL